MNHTCWPQFTTTEENTEQLFGCFYLIQQVNITQLDRSETRLKHTHTCSSWLYTLLILINQDADSCASCLLTPAFSPSVFSALHVRYELSGALRGISGILHQNFLLWSFENRTDATANSYRIHSCTCWQDQLLFPAH